MANAEERGGRQVNTLTPLTFGLGAFALTVACYVPYLYTPVYEYRGDPIYGWEAIVFCFIMPPFWPIAIGHLALWIGLILLIAGRWRAASLSGVAAVLTSAAGLLVLRGESLLLTWPILLKLASMAMLAIFGRIGQRVFHPPTK